MRRQPEKAPFRRASCGRGRAVGARGGGPSLTLGACCRLLLVGLLVMAVPAFLGFSVVYAEPLRQAQRQVQIISPEMNSELRGLVPILGSASIADFQFYKVEFGFGPNPSEWAVIGSLHEVRVINGQLEVWDTNAVPDGAYTLRLQAVKKDGNFDEFVVRQIVVVNNQPTPTPTPTSEPTSALTATLRPTDTPRPTATLRTIGPGGELRSSTLTPTLSRPSQSSSVLGDARVLGQSFVTGVLAMGIVFVVLGVVFGLRRLL